MFISAFPSLLYFLIYFVACASAYRLGAFVHEIVHQKNNKLFDKKFTWIWNLTVGAIALYPSPAFNMHLQHHAVSKFGTRFDPQYPLLFRDGNINLCWAFTLFIAMPLGMPLLNIFRVMLTPVTLIYPSLQTKEDVLFLFRPSVKSLTAKERKMVNYLDCYYFFVLLAITLTCPLLWYKVVVGAWFLSALRIPLEHKLERHKTITTAQDQHDDSFDIPRTWSRPLRSLYSFVVQPLGLNWHQKHHDQPYLYYYQLRD